MPNSSVEPKVARRHPSLLFLPLALPFAILAAVAVYGVVRPPSSNGPPAPGSPGSLVWGNGIFANRVELKAWFALHGGSYAAWAKQHPAALRLVSATSRQTQVVQKRPRVVAVASHTAPQARHTVRQVTHAVRQKAAVPRVAAARSIGVSSTAAAARSWRSGANLVLWLLIVVGILLGAAAAAPERLVHRLPGAALWKERELRIGSAAAGVALLVGVAIATQLS